MLTVSPWVLAAVTACALWLLFPMGALLRLGIALRRDESLNARERWRRFYLWRQRVVWGSMAGIGLTLLAVDAGQGFVFLRGPGCIWYLLALDLPHVLGRLSVAWLAIPRKRAAIRAEHRPSFRHLLLEELVGCFLAAFYSSLTCWLSAAIFWGPTAVATTAAPIRWVALAAIIGWATCALGFLRTMPRRPAGPPTPPENQAAVDAEINHQVRLLAGICGVPPASVRVNRRMQGVLPELFLYRESSVTITGTVAELLEPQAVAALVVSSLAARQENARSRSGNRTAFLDLIGAIGAVWVVVEMLHGTLPPWLRTAVLLYLLVRLPAELLHRRRHVRRTAEIDARVSRTTSSQDLLLRSLEALEHWQTGRVLPEQGSLCAQLRIRIRSLRKELDNHPSAPGTLLGEPEA